MKKIYLSLFAAAAFTTAGIAQELKLTPGSKVPFSGIKNFNQSTNSANKTAANVAVVDTLNYFLNKNMFRNPGTNSLSLATYSITMSGPTATDIVAGGSYFENSGSLVIYGAEVAIVRVGSSPSPSVPFKVELFNASATGFPTGAALASFTAAVSNPTAWVLMGGNFTSSVMVTGNYAIMYSSISTNTLDYIEYCMTAGSTATSTAPTNERYGEGFGLVQLSNGQYYHLNNSFGAGTSYEGVVAPRVGYLYTANNTASTYSTCNTTSVTFVNSTTDWASHRQYNLNKFLSTWPNVAGSNTSLYTTFSPVDSVFTWNFGDGGTSYAKDPSHSYNVSATPITHTLSDVMIVKNKRMHLSGYGDFDSKAWTMTVTVCNVGLTENNIENQFAVYPNPASDKVVVMLNNANTNTQIQVLNALGQVVLTKTNLTEKNELNTESLAKGVYFVRVSNGKESSTSKLIINK